MYKIINQKLEDWSKEYQGERFHAILCDPPYGIEFMAKGWDAPWKQDTRQIFDGTMPVTEENPFTRSKVRNGMSSSYGSKGRAMSLFQAKVTEWGNALLPHLYPGAIVMMFSSPRTWHRLACGMEDAGFECFDSVMWIHAQGFPKAQSISKLIDKRNGDKREVVGRKTGRQAYPVADIRGMNFAGGGAINGGIDTGDITAPGSEQSAPWDGHKTCALKPAWEPILCFRIPSKTNYTENALQYGSGALNIDAARIGSPVPPTGSGSSHVYGWANVEKKTEWEGSSGRYPANLILECCCEETYVVDAPDGIAVEPDGKPMEHSIYGDTNTLGRRCGYDGKAVKHTNPACPAFILDEQAGESTSTSNGGSSERNSHNTEEWWGQAGGGFKTVGRSTVAHGDSGGPSRFFYTAKASSTEREAGLQDQPEQTVSDGREKAADNPYQRGKTLRRNTHPTVKPIKLIEYFAKLLLPPKIRHAEHAREILEQNGYTDIAITENSSMSKPRRILVPFSGSGSEMIGCLQAGWDEVVGIEQEEEYCQIAEKRLKHWTKPDPIMELLGE